MAPKAQRGNAKPAFNRAAVFAEVENSNRRFEDYTKEQRRAFSNLARALKPVRVR